MKLSEILKGNIGILSEDDVADIADETRDQEIENANFKHSMDLDKDGVISDREAQLKVWKDATPEQRKSLPSEFSPTPKEATSLEKAKLLAAVGGEEINRNLDTVKGFMDKNSNTVKGFMDKNSNIIYPAGIGTALGVGGAALTLKRKQK